jgi:hypothetical protein
MENWASEAWVIYMSLAMGVGAFILAKVVSYWYMGSKIPKQHSEWITDLDERLRDLQGAEIHRAVCYRRVADLIGEMPQDFDAVAMTGMQMSDAVGRAILAKSEQLGMYPPGTFEKLGVIPHELPEDPTIEVKQEGSNGSSAMPWIGHFVHGRLVPAAQRMLGSGPPN